MNDSYVNGYRFGISYAWNHGTRSLLRQVKRDETHATAPPYRMVESVSYFAGMVDAALALVQGERNG